MLPAPPQIGAFFAHTTNQVIFDSTRAFLQLRLWSDQRRRDVETEQQQDEEAKGDTKAAAPEGSVRQAEIAGQDQTRFEKGDREDQDSEPRRAAGLADPCRNGRGGEAESDERDPSPGERVYHRSR